VRLQGAYALCTSILRGFACLRLGNSTSSTPLRIRALIRESSIFFVESELAIKVAHVVFGAQGRELIVDRRIHYFVPDVDICKNDDMLRPTCLA